MSQHRNEARRMRLLFAGEASLVFVIGAAAHFLFDAIGRWPPIGWIAPVNESLWEHIKMAFWPALALDWLLGVRLPTIEHRVVCTVASASISTLLIVPFFYGYTSVLGHHYLLADVAIFAAAVCAGHWIAYRVAMGPVPTSASVTAAVALAALLGGALVVFTYAPPPMEVFRDSLTGEFGIGST